MSQNKRNLALITGASSGLGAEYAKQLAAQKSDLILVARNVEKMQAVADKVKATHNVNVEIAQADLAKLEDIQKIVKRIEDSGKIDVLVNNAGFGSVSPFQDSDPEILLAMNSVHVTATTLLSKTVLKGMMVMQRGEIYNISSTAAFHPTPFGYTYSASKAYINVFSECLQLEFDASGIKVQALCPGFTRTGFHTSDTWNMDITEWTKDAHWMEVGDVVRESLEQIGKTGVIYIPGQQNRDNVKAAHNLYYA